MSGGVYVALFVLDRPRTLRVGRLGRFHFEAGRYAYVGSAQRNLDARLARHARRRKPLRWHVDYLARHARLEAAWTWPLPKSAECALAAAIGRCPGATPGPPRFGASDCACPAHLVRLEGGADVTRRLARRFGRPRPWIPKTVDRTPARSYHSPTAACETGMSDAADIIHVSDRQGVKLIRLRTDAVRDELEVEALGRALLALSEEPGARLVLSFLGVRNLTSLILGRLIQAHKRLAQSGGELRLADIDPQLVEVFSITRLDRVFKIFEREDEAVASFLGGVEG